MTSARRTTTTWGSTAAGVLFALHAVGCAEQTMVRTSPPGASLHVDGRFIGVTPVQYRVPERRYSQHTTYRIEHPGYEPLEGEFQTYVTPGRIIGGILGLGIPFAFRGPTAFHKVHDFQMQPAHASNRPVVPAAATTADPSVDATATGKLREIRDLYDRGLISDEEYRAARARVLKGL